MNIILLSGGSGTRLWPLSNSVRSKQFLKVLRDADGNPCSMVQRVFGQIKRVGLVGGGHLLVATGEEQVGSIRDQLGDAVEVVTEPERRDTMPAILLACSYLISKLGCSLDEPAMVMPIDPYVEDAYFERACLVGRSAGEGAADVVLMGVVPTYPSEKYGYILPSHRVEGATVGPVERFVEKPSEEAARGLIESGALWNCGIFGFRLGYVAKILEEALGTLDFDEVRARYGELETTSFDYGVTEKAERVAVVPYEGSWKDIGTWNTLCEEMTEPVSGPVVLGEGCNNVHVVNELDTPIVALGLSDVVIAATRDGILVSDKGASSHNKAYVERVQRDHPMHREFPWGRLEVLDEEPSGPTGGGTSVERIRVFAGASMLGEAFRGSVVVSVVSGAGRIAVSGEERALHSGSVATIPEGSEYRIDASSDFVLVRILTQSGPLRRSDGEIEAEYRRWVGLSNPDEAQELSSLNADGVRDAFWKDLSFGTGGARELMGPGPNRLNTRTVGKLAQALSDYVISNDSQADGVRPSVVIARDSRRNGGEFAQRTACVLAANGVQALVFAEPMPTPVVSFAVRQIGCAAGVVITASHNPAGYNGFKVYGSDGCQAAAELAGAIQRRADGIDPFSDVIAIDYQDGVADGLICEVGEGVFDSYVSAVLSESRGVDCSGLSIAYSPLCGTGLSAAERVLAAEGISEGRGNLVVVPSQRVPDGDFPTCPRPNPEERAAMSEVVLLADRAGCDLALATDPDADRLGVAVRHGGNYYYLTGNELGALLLDWVCSKERASGRDLAGRVAVTTIVTSPMISAVAEKWGIELRTTLTGFKYCGEQMGILESEGRGKAFLMGVEESYGLLAGDYVRDKDGIEAMMLACEAAADYRSGGMDLVDALEELRREVGFYRDVQVSKRFPGSGGADKMRSIVRSLRMHPPRDIAGRAVLRSVDYSGGVDMPVLNAAPEEARRILPASDALQLDLEGGARAIVRPSGTEPKLKVYLSVHGATEEESDMLLKALMVSVSSLLGKSR